MSEETIRLIRKKKLYKKAKRSDTQGDLLRYKRVSNLVCRLTRRNHQDHLKDISCQLVGNQRIFWRWLQNVRGQSAGIPNLKYMGNISTAAVDKAKVFNHYFCSESVFVKENISNLPRLRSLLWATSIADIEFDADEVYKVLCGINPSKTCGPDEIPGRLLIPNYFPCLCSQDPFLEIGEEPTLLQCSRGVTNTPLPTISLLV